MARNEQYTFQFGKIPVSVRLNRASAPYDVHFSNYDATTKGKARQLYIDENRAYKDGVLNEDAKIGDVIMKGKVKGYDIGDKKNPNVLFFEDAELERFETAKNKTLVQLKIEPYNDIPTEMVYKVYAVEPAEGGEGYYAWVMQRLIANNWQARLFVVESNQYREAILQVNPLTGVGKLTVLMFPSEVKMPAKVEMVALKADEAQAVDFALTELKDVVLEKLDSKKKEVIKELVDIKLGLKKPEEIKAIEEKAVPKNDLMKMLISEKKRKVKEEEKN